MEEQKHPTLNEIFAEQISLLHKINPARHCAACNDQMFLGFTWHKDGSIDLMKCFCAMWGPTEYSRIQEHLHNIDANHAEQMKVVFENVQKMADYLKENMEGLAQYQSESVKRILRASATVHKHTFFGGIRLVYGLAIMYVHDGWMFLKREWDQLKIKNDSMQNEKGKSELPDCVEHLKDNSI